MSSTEMSITEMSITEMSTIEYTDIVMHDPSIEPPFPDDSTDRFGILKIKMNKVCMTNTPLFLLFTIDITGSMGENVNYGSTKLDYVKQTFKSMLMYLSRIDIDIYIKVITFNNDAYVTIDTVKLTPDNLDLHIDTINKLRADKTTDIGIALCSANIAILDYIKNHTDHDVAHIFMTDGQATAGETSTTALCDFIDDSYANIFVGIGHDHSANVLRKFSERKLAEYQFVDNMENTALVYGETIHRFLYPAIKNVRIQIENGVIYNWQTNEWTTEITDDVFIGEIEKIYHIKTGNVNRVCVRLFGVDVAVDNAVRLLDTIYPIPPLISIETGEIVSNSDENLMKYMFRQRVQELLYLARNVETRSDISSAKIQLKKSFDVLRSYMRTNDLLEDPFLKQLCEDIHVTYRTMGTRVGHMYSTARQRTQGMQRAYTTSSTPRTDDRYDLLPNEFPNVFTNTRLGMRRHSQILRSNASDEFDDFHDPLPRAPSIDALNIDIPAINVTSNDGSLFPEDDLDNYVTEDTNISCYSTPTVVNTMRSLSQPSTADTTKL